MGLGQVEAVILDFFLVNVGIGLLVPVFWAHEVGEFLSEYPAVHMSVKINNYNHHQKSIL